jgi:hypothetical protein
VAEEEEAIPSSGDAPSSLVYAAHLYHCQRIIQHIRTTFTIAVDVHYSQPPYALADPSCSAI